MHDLEKLMADMAKTKKMAAEAVKESTVGKCVFELIGRDATVSVASITAALEDTVANSPSARGKCAPEQDLSRLAAEAALNHIRSLQRPGGG